MNLKAILLNVIYLGEKLNVDPSSVMTEKGFIFGNSSSNKISGFSDLKNTPTLSFTEKLKEHKDDSFEKTSEVIENTNNSIDDGDPESGSELNRNKDPWEIPINKHKSKLFLKSLNEKEWHDHGYVLCEIVKDHEGRNFGS